MRHRAKVSLLKLHMLLMVDVKPLSLPLGHFELKAHLVVLGNASMSFPSRDNFLHDLAVTIHVNDCCPCIDPNYIHFYLDSLLYVVLLVDLKMLELKNCSFSSLHTGDESLNFLMVFT